MIWTRPDWPRLWKNIERSSLLWSTNYLRVWFFSSFHLRVHDTVAPTRDLHYMVQSTLAPVLQLVNVNEFLLTSRLSLILFQARIMNIVPQPSDHHCPICCEVYYRPVRLECSHLFCHSCVLKLIRNKMFSCPVCRRSDAIKNVNAKNIGELSFVPAQLTTW